MTFLHHSLTLDVSDSLYDDALYIISMTLLKERAIEASPGLREQ